MKRARRNALPIVIPATAVAALALTTSVASAELWVYPVVIDSNIPFAEGLTPTAPRIGDVPVPGVPGRYSVLDPILSPVDIRYALVAEITSGTTPNLNQLTGRMLAYGEPHGSAPPMTNPFVEVSFTPSSSPVDFLAGPGASAGAAESRSIAPMPPLLPNGAWFQSVGSSATTATTAASNLVRLVPPSGAAGNRFILGTGRIRTDVRLDGISFGFDIASPTGANPGTAWQEDGPLQLGQAGAVARWGNVFRNGLAGSGGGARLTLIGRSQPTDVQINSGSVSSIVTATGSGQPNFSMSVGFDWGVTNAVAFVHLTGPEKDVASYISSVGGAPLNAAGSTLASYNAVVPVARATPGFLVDAFKLSNETILPSGAALTSVGVVGGSVWKYAATNTWSDSSAWFGSVPNQSGQVAAFGIDAPGPTPVTVNQPHHIAVLGIDSPFQHSFVGTGTLVFESSGASSPPRLDIRAGSHSIDVPISLGDDEVEVAIVDGATATVTAPIFGTAGLRKTGGGSLLLTGSAANAFTGTTSVDAGTLVLSKQNLDPSSNGHGAAVRDLVIGANATIVLSQSHQIREDALVSLDGGTFALAGNSFDSFRYLQLNGGQVVGGVPNSGAGIGLQNFAGLRGVKVTADASISAAALALDGQLPFDVDPGVTLTVATFVTDLYPGGGGGGVSKSGGGTVVLSGSSANTYSAGTTVNTGTLVAAKPDALGTGALAVTGGTTTFSAGLSRATRLQAISLSGNGIVDLNDNDLVIGSATSRAAVEQYIKNARHGGLWDSPGLTSSAARANPVTGLGVLSGAEYSSLGGTGTFAGQTYSPTDTLVKYTWNGDANLSGAVDFDDYVRTDVGFNTGRTGWSNGDFNYSGSVNFDDYVLIDVAFNTQSGTLGRAIQYLDGTDRGTNGLGDASVQEVVQHFGQFGTPYATAFLAAVPEPMAAGAIALGVSAVCARRKRR